MSCLITCKIQYSLRNVFRSSHPFDRRVLQEEILEILGQVLHNGVSCSHAREYGIAADVISGSLGGDQFSEIVDGSFAGTITDL